MSALPRNLAASHRARNHRGCRTLASEPLLGLLPAPRAPETFLGWALGGKEKAKMATGAKILLLEAPTPAQEFGNRLMWKTREAPG